MNTNPNHDEVMAVLAQLDETISQTIQMPLYSRAAYYQAMAQEAAEMQSEATKLNLELPRAEPVLHRPTQIYLVKPPVGMRDPMTFWRSVFVYLGILFMGVLLGVVIVWSAQIWTAMRGWL